MSKQLNKINAAEKEKKLLVKIEKAKSQLLRLQDKRRLELGKIACKHGLDQYDNTVLEKHFAALSKELANGNP